MIFGKLQKDKLSNSKQSHAQLIKHSHQGTKEMYVLRLGSEHETCIKTEKYYTTLKFLS